MCKKGPLRDTGIIFEAAAKAIKGPAMKGKVPWCSHIIEGIRNATERDH